ncbi:unnamed protein product [Arabis nemorensis]|uniref:TRF2/HOY1 PH-like domain-containing protein n=1 Tax=Arabis nemorensis TaxID=586526 RepID=A0A565AKR4_9BRAS|nr:unnamed protein product [Arabis nemorensis]
MNFPISKITIGQWTRIAVYPDDLKAKFYFAKKKLMWEFLDNVDTETRVAKLKRKIEIQWSHVLSFKPTFHSHDETGILQVELSKRPTFFLETNPQAGRHTQWKQMDQDFTQDQYASKCRRHTLHFAPGVLQKNLEKLLSSDSFWSELIKVNFPSLEDPYFDSGHGNSNKNNISSNLSHYNHHDQALSFNVNNDIHHHYSQGFGHVGVGEVNFNTATQYNANDGRQMSSFVQDNLHNSIANQFHGTQVTQPLSQPINEHYDIGRYISETQFNNSVIQEESQMRNTGELLGSQAFLETQTNSITSQHMSDVSVYPEIGPYLQSILAQEGETHNLEHTHILMVNCRTT